MTQKDAVFSVVTSIIVGSGIKFQVNKDVAANILTKDMRTQVNNALVEKFLTGDVELSDEARGKLTDEPALRAYVSGLVSNWLRKDSRLNGGIAAPKKSNADPQLKALKKLQSSQTDPSRRLEIQTFIDKRTSELNG